jgi:glutamine---fructose-6-phosphate transaminase (isomerizing)
MPNQPTGYLRDILDQPIALRDTLAALTDLSALRPFADKLASGELRRVVLTGMGSSYHALHPLALTLLARGVLALMIETSELIHHAPALIEPSTLLVVVSQSGQSPETLKLLEKAQGQASIIGVTNTAGSPLAKQSDAFLLMRAGSEYTVSTKTYLATLVALPLLGDALTGHDPAQTHTALSAAPEVVEQYLAQWPAHVEMLTERLNGIRFIMLVGRGTSLAAVGTGGLILKESTHFPAEGMSSAAFRHGPLEMISPDDFVLVFAGGEPTIQFNARLAADIQAAGGRTALVVESLTEGVFSLPPIPEVARPILEILPPQMISLALAQLLGREAGRFERATKITATE